MFYYTYILKSLKDRKMYTGFTRNLKLRFEQHNQGLSQSTKSRKPFKLIYYEACLDKKDAMKREKYFKTHFGKMFLKNRLKSYLTGGFTLLMSLLVISIILSIGLGVSDVIIRETKISGLGRESQVAFSAADAGVECAFFWEIKHPGLAQSAFNAANIINCAGNSVSNAYSGNVSNFTLNLGNSSCVSVKVDKASSQTQTIIESRGYNTDCGAVSPFKVERAIRLTLNKILPVYRWVNIGTVPNPGGPRLDGESACSYQEVATYTCDSSTVGTLLYDGTARGISCNPDWQRQENCHSWPIYSGEGSATAREYMPRGGNCGLGSLSNVTLNVWECQAQ